MGENREGLTAHKASSCWCLGRSCSPGDEQLPIVVEPNETKASARSRLEEERGNRLVREVPIKLSDAPARFFPADWARLAALKGGQAQASQALDNPTPSDFAYYRRGYLASNPAKDMLWAEMVADEEGDTLVNRLREALRRLGTEGRIVASGLFAGTGLNQDIPAELWATAKITFGAERLESSGLVYHHVIVELASVSIEKDEVKYAISAWLDRRRSVRGAELKKVLQDAARVEFARNFTVREFNSAYAASYKRGRGRPGK